MPEPSTPDQATLPPWPTAATAAIVAGARVARLCAPVPEPASLDAAICVPARNEAERIEPCIAALAGQAARIRRRVGLVVGINNSADRSLDIACRTAARFGVPFLGLQAFLPAAAATAPGARRWVMDLGARLVARHGALLTTDADSVVQPGWLSANLEELARGSDAVCGLLRGTPDAADLPQLRAAGRRLELRYRRALLEVEALLDPDPLNPWPHHGQAAGPSLAISLAAYRRVGGLPTPAFGEDKALIARLRACGGRIRYSSRPEVVTSCRLDGRAQHGFADFLLHRGNDPDSHCDEGLEDLATRCLRAGSRGRLRRARDRAAVIRVAEALAVQGPCRRTALEMALDGSIGAAWAVLEAGSPLLAPRRIRPSEIAAQLSDANRLLGRLRDAGGNGLTGGSADPADTPCDVRAV